MALIAHRNELLARSLLTIGALLPYFPLLNLSTLYVTDDIFSSDIFQGELPFRYLTAQAVKQGHFPLWTDKLCSGTPLGIGEPIGFLSFALLPTAAALDLFVIIMLLIAAHGTYGFARRIGASRPGAVLGGIAFAGSGFIACQLKHLGILATVVWLPLALTLLDRAFSKDEVLPVSGEESRATPPSNALRALWLTLFGLVFAEQILAGFPQSAYICGLIYGAYAVFRASTLRGTWRRIPVGILWLAAAGAVVAVAVVAGAIVLRPLSDFAIETKRASLGFEWAVKVSYWPRNALTFFIPYINGDVSDDSYRGPSMFWEDYGYLGVATVSLAFYGVARNWRRSHVVFLGVMTVVAYLLVLGPNTPFYHFAWTYLPGLKMFRLPTRFLFVVDFGVAALGAMGLSRLDIDLRRWLQRSAPMAPQWIIIGLCAGTALDLFIHQTRQNPMVPAGEWLEPPPLARVLQQEGSDVRTLTLQHRELHARVFRLAKGWTDLEPHNLFRDSLQPNTGAYWGIAAADCYLGAAPPWVTNTWGDHNSDGLLISRAIDPPAGMARPPLARILGALGVTHVLSPLDLAVKGLKRIPVEGVMNLYRVQGSKRLRVIPRARVVKDDPEAADAMLAQSFAPDQDVLLHDPLPAPESISTERSSGDVELPGPTITRRAAHELEIDAVGPPSGGYLFLAENYDGSWVAEVDGKPTPVVRANLTGRAIVLPPGHHKIRYVFRPIGHFRNLGITAAGLFTLLLGMTIAASMVWRGRRAGRADFGQTKGRHAEV